LIAMRAYWGVHAGLIPGDEMREYLRQWSYTSADYEADGNRRGERYKAIEKEARDYAAELSFGGLNWVNVEYLWL
jgi:hypothetical protein